MNRKLRFAVAGVAAVLIETGIVWLLAVVAMMGTAIAFTIAFVVGYLTLFAVLCVLGPVGVRPSLWAQMRAHSLLGLTILLVVVASVSFCVGLLGAGVAATNAVTLLAVAFWVALSRRFGAGDASL